MIHFKLDGNERGRGRPAQQPRPQPQTIHRLSRNAAGDQRHILSLRRHERHGNRLASFYKTGGVSSNTPLRDIFGPLELVRPIIRTARTRTTIEDKAINKPYAGDRPDTMALILFSYEKLPNVNATITDTSCVIIDNGGEGSFARKNWAECHLVVTSTKAKIRLIAGEVTTNIYESLDDVHKRTVIGDTSKSRVAVIIDRPQMALPSTVKVVLAVVPWHFDDLHYDLLSGNPNRHPEFLKKCMSSWNIKLGTRRRSQ